MDTQTPRRIRRRKYLVNRRLQMAVTLQLMAVMAGMGLLYTVALHIFPGSGIGELSAEEMRSFLTKATAMYFGLATAILGTLAIIVTHRIAGPVYVIHCALKAMREHDYSARLTLRRRDHLKGLAKEVAGLRDEMMDRDQKVRDLHSCLEEGDIEGAREIFARLGVHAEAPAAARKEATAER